MSERFRVICSDAGDGTGDVYVPLPAQLLKNAGLALGDRLSIEVRDGVIELRRLPDTAASSLALAVALRAETHTAYRRALNTYLPIPPDATEHAIHELIEAGFSASHLQAICDQEKILPAMQERVIPLKTLVSRCKENQSLSLEESDRLFRLVHVIAMSDAIFGDQEKAKRWLSKPKRQLAGKSPTELLSTSAGTHQVEELLIRVAEGLYS